MVQLWLHPGRTSHPEAAPGIAFSFRPYWIHAPGKWYNWVGLDKYKIHYMFLYVKFWSWIFKRSSKLQYKQLNTKILYFHNSWGGRPVWKPSYPLAGANNEKIHQSAAQAVILVLLREPRPSLEDKTCIIPAFFEIGLSEKRTTWAHTSRPPKNEEIRGFFYRAAKNFKNLRSKYIFFKYIAVEEQPRAYPIVKLTGRSNLAGQYL